VLGVAAFVRSALVVAAVVLVLAPTASASSPEFDPGIDRETHLLSQTFNGTWPDGPSQDPAFSQDRQYASVAAFDSDADNLVAGDTNGTTDVFAVYRRQPYSLAGEPWQQEEDGEGHRGDDQQQDHCRERPTEDVRDHGDRPGARGPGSPRAPMPSPAFRGYFLVVPMLR